MQMDNFDGKNSSNLTEYRKCKNTTISSPSHFSAHIYCGQTVAHLSNCWALVIIYYISRESWTSRNVLWSRHGRLCVYVCLSVCARPHDHTIARTRMKLGGVVGMPLVVHYWADLQPVHELRCYGNITRTRNVSEYMLVRSMPSCTY